MDAFLIPVLPALRNVFEISPLIPAKPQWFCSIIEDSGRKCLNQALLLGLTLLLLGDRQNTNYSISLFLPELRCKQLMWLTRHFILVALL